ncbi:hypothetical protein [Agrobacterium sp. NPDC090283]|uniref:hypothetical protein n=1 Tax=Agrobacterium sp. NPDC090283 TaxID=3363920 RepID=UPI00383BCEEE
MTRAVSMIVGGCLLAAPAVAEERPLPLRQPFKLDTETGCFDYTGTAAVFDGRFKRGAYVSVTMDDPARIPAMDAPEYKTSEPGFWFGPLPKTGSYSIMFMPGYLHGTPGTVLICGRTFAPGSREEAAHRNEVVDDIMANDLYSRALLKQPKTLAVHPDADSPQADV